MLSWSKTALQYSRLIALVVASSKEKRLLILDFSKILAKMKLSKIQAIAMGGHIVNS